MKYPGNREHVETLSVDLLGFIFYPPSKRYVGENPESNLFDSEKQIVGVFVNENAFKILSLAKKFGFEFVQLHGKENPKTCRMLKKQGLKIIKAFNIDESFKFESIKAYEKVVDYFLFDTKSKLPGGSGEKFNWNVLKKYTGNIPFFLSGGIQPEDALEIKKIDHLKFAGIDLNSGFEDKPGLKNIDKLNQFIHELEK